MLKAALERFGPRGAFGRGVAALTGGSAISQGLAVLSAPILTRVFTPSDLGLFGAFWALATLAAIGAGLRYEFIIPSAESDRDADLLLLTSLVVSLPVSLLCAGFLWGAIRADILSIGMLPGWSAFVLVPVMLSVGAGTAVRFWLVRKARYTTIAVLVMRQGVARLVVTIGAGFAGLGWLGLAMGETAGRVAGVLAPAREALGPFREMATADLRRDLRAVAQRFVRAPRIILPSHILDALTTALTLPLVLHHYGAASAGLLALVQRITSVPAAFLGGSVADVFHGEVSAHARTAPERIRPVFLRTTGRLAVLGLVTFVPLAAIAPWGFALVFGDAWRDAGLLTAGIVPWALAALVVSPVSRLLAVLRREAWKLYYDLLAVVFLVGGIVVGASRGLSFLETILLTSVLQTVAYLGFMVLLLRAIRSPGAGIRRPMVVEGSDV